MDRAWIVHLEEVWFEPLQGDTLEVRLCEDDFGVVLDKCPRVILKVQLALHKKNPEFARISPIKLVLFLDFCML